MKRNAKNQNSLVKVTPLVCTVRTRTDIFQAAARTQTTTNYLFTKSTVRGSNAEWRLDALG